MNLLPDLDEMLGLLRSRGQLLASGLSDRRIAAKVQNGEFTRIRPGWFIATETWKASTPVDQHLLRALCIHSSTTRAPVFSGLTAAAILGLPLLRFDTERVHVLQPRTMGKGSSAGLVHHRQDFDQTEVLQRGPLSCTSVSRTLIDIARTCSFEQGVVAGDAGLRFQTSAGPLTADANRSSLLQNLRALPGTRGARRATRVLGFLDDQAESPLESLFRLQFARLGFEVRTQVPVPSPNGGRYRMDFELIGHRTFFEADGRAKYTDEQYLRGRKPEDLLLEEKRREDWIRGTQDYRVLRGGWNDALSPRATAKLLREFGIVSPVDPGHRMPPELY